MCVQAFDITYTRTCHPLADQQLLGLAFSQRSCDSHLEELSMRVLAAKPDLSQTIMFKVSTFPLETRITNTRYGAYPACLSKPVIIGDFIALVRPRMSIFPDNWGMQMHVWFCQDDPRANAPCRRAHPHTDLRFCRSIVSSSCARCSSAITLPRSTPLLPLPSAMLPLPLDRTEAEAYSTAAAAAANAITSWDAVNIPMVVQTRGATIMMNSKIAHVQTLQAWGGRMRVGELEKPILTATCTA